MNAHGVPSVHAGSVTQFGGVFLLLQLRRGIGYGHGLLVERSLCSRGSVRRAQRDLRGCCDGSCALADAIGGAASNAEKHPPPNHTLPDAER